MNHASSPFKGQIGHNLTIDVLLDTNCFPFWVINASGEMKKFTNCRLWEPHIAGWLSCIFVDHHFCLYILIYLLSRKIEPFNSWVQAYFVSGCLDCWFSDISSFLSLIKLTNFLYIYIFLFFHFYIFFLIHA